MAPATLRTRSRSNRLERADRPTADELTIREAAARGLFAYSGIQLAYPERRRGRNSRSFGLRSVLKATQC